MNGLEIEDLSVRYGRGNKSFAVIKSVSLSIAEGATLGLVGESGSGKSTLAKAIVGLVPSSGRILLDGQPLSYGHRGAGRRRPCAVQPVFQDPHASLNPRMTIGDAIAEAVSASMAVSGGQRRMEVSRLLASVGMDESANDRYPHQFSGGQRQRAAIARTLALRPRVLIADEVTSSLDVSVQANILNLLKGLQAEYRFSCLFISHDLATVRYMSDQVAVMYAGTIVENAMVARIFSGPRHPYARALIDSIPRLIPTGNVMLLGGEPPDPRRPPLGCPFHTRCPIGPRTHPNRLDPCASHAPTEKTSIDGSSYRCHFPLTGSDGLLKLEPDLTGAQST